MGDLQERVREWDEYFTINCHLPAAAILDLFGALDQKDAEIDRLREIINTRLPDQGQQIKRLKTRIAKLEAVLEAVQQHDHIRPNCLCTSCRRVHEALVAAQETRDG